MMRKSTVKNASFSRVTDGVEETCDWIDYETTEHIEPVAEYIPIPFIPHSTQNGLPYQGSIMVDRMAVAFYGSKHMFEKLKEQG